MDISPRRRMGSASVSSRACISAVVRVSRSQHGRDTGAGDDRGYWTFSTGFNFLLAMLFLFIIIDLFNKNKLMIYYEQKTRFNGCGID
ncbi:hypothetical protein [Oligosphaera ethanolica]|uniref:Uncharacterized protein n=1 Tax=Oligosphaera ethanolica TaxID=760260 RepID=A0AAE4AP50_9BACT|nr:hypothetical protein [Oligosphaera ethanolica]MDQ0289603.1 hypothetical protein [Oligosphaera ethanolica]